jgi:hypothetical protein
MPSNCSKRSTVDGLETKDIAKRNRETFGVFRHIRGGLRDSQAIQSYAEEQIQL